MFNGCKNFSIRYEQKYHIHYLFRYFCIRSVFAHTVSFFNVHGVELGVRSTTNTSNSINQKWNRTAISHSEFNHSFSRFRFARNSHRFPSSISACVREEWNWYNRKLSVIEEALSVVQALIDYMCFFFTFYASVVIVTTIACNSDRF